MNGVDPLQEFSIRHDRWDRDNNRREPIAAMIPAEGAAITVDGRTVRVLAWCVTVDGHVYAVAQHGRDAPVVVNPRSPRVRGDR
jgi:hypothetical protein